MYFLAGNCSGHCSKPLNGVCAFLIRSSFAQYNLINYCDDDDIEMMITYHFYVSNAEASACVVSAMLAMLKIVLHHGRI